MNTSHSDAALDVVRRLNEAWRAGRAEALASLFHERAVIVDAMHEALAEGREACVESYRTFASSATVEAYEGGAPAVRVFGSTAVVTYPFEMVYRTGGVSYREAGSDALVLTRAGEQWQVVWRQLVWHAV